MRLISDGIVDREGVAGHPLAARLGYRARQVQRQLNAEVSAGPIAVARILLETTDMRAAEVAFAAGFSSVRQFNDTVRQIYAATPSRLREPGRALVAVRGARLGVPLRLAHRGPYAASEGFDYLGNRAIDGIEQLTGERGARMYRRTLRLPHGTGTAEVGTRPAGLPAPRTARPGRRGSP